MMRTLPLCAVLLALTPAVRSADKPEPTETVIRMKLRPAAAPIPALKYQLLPELTEMNPGNPIFAYTKCFAQQHNFWHGKQIAELRENWQKMPLKDLPLDGIKKSHNRGNPLRYADQAARLDTPDWQILLPIKSEGANLMLPHLQSFRELAGALKVRFRVEIAERRFDDALVTAQTMLALARHLGENPTVIGNLVGLAVASLTLGPLDEMIQQPDSPNLFWALTNLPYPFLDLRKGFQGEHVFLMKEFAALDDRAPMTDAQVDKVVDRLRQLLEVIRVNKNLRDWLNAAARNEDRVRAARKRLLESGLAKNNVKRFSASQVILLEEKLEFEVRRDEVRKVMMLPYWQAEPALRAARQPQGKREDTLFTGLIASDKVKLAQTRVEQRLGLLRCVEALRLHAAEHDGKLPAKLDDIKLPLPVDPVSGKPFVYKLDGVTASLRGTPPPGQESIAAYNVRYDVTIAK